MVNGKNSLVSCRVARKKPNAEMGRNGICMICGYDMLVVVNPQRG
jgi:hypothetical protein